PPLYKAGPAAPDHSNSPPENHQTATPQYQTPPTSRPAAVSNAHQFQTPAPHPPCWPILWSTPPFPPQFQSPDRPWSKQHYQPPYPAPIDQSKNAVPDASEYISHI